MDGLFTRYVLDELRVLMAEIEAGQEPSNIALYERVVSFLRPTFDRNKR